MINHLYGGNSKRSYNAYLMFVQRLSKNGHVLLSKYINAKTNVLIDFGCGHSPSTMNPNQYNNGYGCPICSGRRLKVGENDIATVRPDLIQYFSYLEEAQKYTEHSSKYVELYCPNCGTPKTMKICNLSNYGFTCDKCSDGISYPNKFMYNLLNELDVNFNAEVRFDWCCFKSFNDNEKFNYGLYDFVIEDLKLIIEMDGCVGHGDNKHYKKFTTNDETKYRDIQKDKLATNNGYNIIRVDCKYKNTLDRFEYVKSSVVKSLSGIFDLINVDFNKIHKNSLNSFVMDACDLWNKNYKISEICSVLKRSDVTVAKYLKEGNTLGLCEYNQDVAEERRINAIRTTNSKPVSISDGLYFASIKYLSSHYSKLGIKLIPDCISNACKKKIPYKGYTFQYITKQEFNTIKTQSPELAFGDYFISTEESNNNNTNNIKL